MNQIAKNWQVQQVIHCFLLQRLAAWQAPVISDYTASYCSIRMGTMCWGRGVRRQQYTSLPRGFFSTGEVTYCKNILYDSEQKTAYSDTSIKMYLFKYTAEVQRISYNTLSYMQLYSKTRVWRCSIRDTRNVTSLWYHSLKFTIVSIQSIIGI